MASNEGWLMPKAPTFMPMMSSCKTLSTKRKPAGNHKASPPATLHRKSEAALSSLCLAMYCTNAS
eukprot:4427069-Alexandrium_andersonii.AAC.1